MGPEALTFHSQFIKQGDLVFDVGANIGNRTALYLSLGAKVVCFEPQPNCINALISRFGSQVIVVPEGLGSKAGLFEFSICSAAPTISTFSEQWKVGRFKDFRWDSKAVVKVDTLDAAILRFGVPAFCKIDVEGFEFEVLSGLSHPISLSFEYTSECLDQAQLCIGRLSGLGIKQFNYTLGENMGFEGDWISGAEVMGAIRGIGVSDAWGDIYARYT